jgi:hypothetical protein
MQRLPPQQINEEASERILQIEQEAMRKRRPIMKKRGTQLRQIDEFWPSVLRAHPTLQPLMSDMDWEVLQSVVEVRGGVAGCVHCLGLGLWRKLWSVRMLKQLPRRNVDIVAHHPTHVETRTVTPCGIRACVACNPLYLTSGLKGSLCILKQQQLASCVCGWNVTMLRCMAPRCGVKSSEVMMTALDYKM